MAEKLAGQCCAGLRNLNQSDKIMRADTSASRKSGKTIKCSGLGLPLQIIQAVSIKQAVKMTRASSTATVDLDRPLHAVGFVYDLISPQKVIGQFKVTKNCCQPFEVLHGGVSALVAEAVASMGAYVASGFRRVAGIQLSTNHTGAAVLGDLVQVEAQPLQLGRTIQVWEVQLWRINTSDSKNKVLLSASRVTLLCNQKAPKQMKAYEEIVKNYAKL